MSRIEKAIEKAHQLREEAKADKKTPEKAVMENTVEVHEPIKISQTETRKIADSIRNPYLVTLSDPDSPIAEEYRKLKSLVVQMTKKNKLQNTIMITSTYGGEGKSITALNLAISLAQEYDHTVLLVDADLRRPAIDEYLGIRTETGLTDCLLNGTDVSSALIKTDIGKLTLLPSGKRASNPVELFTSNKLKTLVKELKHSYADRYIIFDTPPILPFAEAHSLGSLVDGVIFVVREGSSPLHSIKDALTMLKDANILGVTYNDVELNPLDGHYYYYNQYKSYSKK